jgi:hypothetical protein
VDNQLFVVKHAGAYHGPFLSHETAAYISRLEGASEILALHVPRPRNESRGPTIVHFMEDDDYRAHVDSFKIDTRQMLVGILQELDRIRRDERVLTAREVVDVSRELFRVSRAIESLMHYVETVIAEPSKENLDALRKAFWRNRDSDDVDPHYDSRFW